MYIYTSYLLVNFIKGIVPPRPCVRGKCLKVLKKIENNKNILDFFFENSLQIFFEDQLVAILHLLNTKLDWVKVRNIIVSQRR